MALHQLALPLPAAYAQDERDGISFFTATTEEGQISDDESGVRHAAPVERYLDDLCEFLQRGRLIQNNPQHYLDYCNAVSRAANERDSEGLALPVTSSFTLSLDGVTPEDWRRTIRLCAQCAQVLKDTSDVAAVVRDGPGKQSTCDVPELQTFYDRTRALTFGRTRDPDNRSAQRTLCLTNVERTLAKGTVHFDDAANDDDDDKEPCSCEETAAAVRKERHARRVLQLILGHGMSVKKRHEVAIMRDTIRDLVWCCNLPTTSRLQNGATDDALCDVRNAGTDMAVHTVINIGEGKGYVSRAIAFCDGLQVIGLDCNAGHKERAAERIENVLEHSLAVTYEDTTAPCGTTHERRLVSLLYEPRGYMCSIACRVDQTVDWAELLRGHVRTVHECYEGMEDVGAVQEKHVTAEKDDIADGLVKDRCRCCGTLLRRTNTAVALKHIYSHLRCIGDEASGCGEVNDAGQKDKDGPATGLPTRAEVREWLVQLPQDVYVARIMRAFLEPATSASSARLLRATNSEEEEVDTRRTDVTHYSIVAQTLQMRHVARGRRVVVLHAVSAANPSEAASAATTAVGPKSCSLRVATLTVVGHDDAAQRHRVVFDGSATREGYRLVGLPAELASRLTPHIDAFTRDDATGGSSDALHEQALLECLQKNCSSWLDDAAVTWAQQKEALVLAVLPVRAASSYAVCVPSLRNCVIIGLHTCGDLGAQICRLFARSGARGLLLVSCCWHALSGGGFPLSWALRRRGVTIDHLSLQLATQPFDMWASISPTGHRSSARLLFFRGLLSLMWREWLPLRWQSAQHNAHACHAGEQGDAVKLSSESLLCNTDNEGCGVCNGDFVAEPHLEPGFLRRMRLHKAELRFDDFVDAVRQEYVCNTRAGTPARPCQACRTKQSAFLSKLIESGAVAAFGAEQMESNFDGFVGFTVLRMWMCQLVEGLLLFDRTLYLQEQAMCGEWARQPTAVSLVPLFDGAVSPRMYGILARRA